MPSKIFEVEGIGPLTIIKSRRSKHLRLSVTAKNEARVSIPSYVPYATGLRFALSKKDWLLAHLAARSTNVYQDGSRIGKSYRLKFEADSQKSIVKIRANEIIIYGQPANMAAEIERNCEKALRLDAQKLLPMRLEQLADKHGYNYKDLKIRKLTSRWGSCSSEKRITLSFLLIQLPWELIDYVILHELNHTINMNHGPKFWADMERLMPGARLKRKQLRQYKSGIIPIAS